MSYSVINFLTDLLAAWQVARIYETAHPKFIKSLDELHKGLEDILLMQDDIVVGIVGDEFASGDEIFFELSKKMKAVATHLKAIGVERITFNRGTTKDEMLQFIIFLTTSKENLSDKPESDLRALGVRNIEIGKIKDASQGHYLAAVKGVGQKTNRMQNYENCLDTLSGSINSLIDGETFDGSSFMSISTNIMENLLGSYQEFFKLKEIKSHDMVTFIHILNVSVLSMFFASKSGFSKENCLAIGTAGLFHDVGKLYIGRRIIQKTGKLSDREFGKIKSHTILGSEILLKHVDKLTILPVVVAFEHHLDYDLGGYPKVYFKRKLHVASMIVAICDVYDALMQRRSYKNDYPPEMIYDIMMRGRGKKFSPKLLDKFFSIMGIWPIGTVVALSNKSITIVRQINEEFIFSPLVEVVSGNKRKLIDLAKEKKIKIEHSLNPLNEGKKYLDLV